jgi:hypothetical protein
MKVHLINPSALSFGVGVITPRWLYVLAAATPESYGDPIISDETLDPWNPETVSAGDVVGIGIHTGNAVQGYEIGRKARERGAYVVFGGIHATLYPEKRPAARRGAQPSSRATATSCWAPGDRGLRPQRRASADVRRWQRSEGVRTSSLRAGR